MMKRFLYHLPAQWVCFGVLTLLAFALWFFAVRDEANIQANTARRIDDEQLSLRRVEVQVAEIDTLFERYQQNTQEIDYFQEHFLRQKALRIRRISAFLETIARERGVKLADIRYTTLPSRSRSLEVYTMDLPLKGRYRDIRNLIGDIEASDMFLVISKLSLKDISDQQGAVEVELTLSTFFEGGGS